MELQKASKEKEYNRMVRALSNRSRQQYRDCPESRRYLKKSDSRHRNGRNKGRVWGTECLNYRRVYNMAWNQRLAREFTEVSSSAQLDAEDAQIQEDIEEELRLDDYFCLIASERLRCAGMKNGVRMTQVDAPALSREDNHEGTDRINECGGSRTLLDSFS